MSSFMCFLFSIRPLCLYFYLKDKCLLIGDRSIFLCVARSETPEDIKVQSFLSIRYTQGFPFHSCTGFKLSSIVCSIMATAFTRDLLCGPVEVSFPYFPKGKGKCDTGSRLGRNFWSPLMMTLATHQILLPSDTSFTCGNSM
jgi:hypothetical protein